MAISTYAELQTAIADFLNRDDLTAMIPNFITLGEATISRDLRHLSQEKRVTTSLDERYEILPADFLEMRRITLGDGTPLRPMSADEMGMARYKNNDIAGKPLYFYNTAYELEFYPTPDEAYPMTMLYYARIPALADDQPSSWLLESHPDVMLYSALLHSAPYLQDDARVQIWASLYQSAMDKLNLESHRSQYSGGTLVMRP